MTGPGNDRRENTLPLSRKYRGDTRSLRVPRRLLDSSSPAVGICFVVVVVVFLRGDENRTNPGRRARNKTWGRADDVSGG